MPRNDAFAKLATNSGSIFEETVRILVKIADNIIKNPHNLKMRTLQKSNVTIKNKILATKGGLECLKLMGFQESDSAFILPATTPLTQVDQVKNTLLNLRTNQLANGSLEQWQGEVASSSKNEILIEEQELADVNKFILPPLTHKFKNPFLRKLEVNFHHALAFNDKACQRRAKNFIPLAKLEENALNSLRNIQRRIKKEGIPDPELSLQDLLLLELLAWFKGDFFTWVDSPPCSKCQSKTTMSHMSTDPEDLLYTKRVEVYKCTNMCSSFTKFPRYNDLNILLETRKGRCGEWAQVFTLLCLSLGWDSRYVIDELDHVWTEVYSVARRRWVHCDPCENICDSPLIYENGWNKKLSYIIAYSPEEVQDVTWRYSGDHKGLIQRRRQCTETELIQAMFSLRSHRQKLLTQARRNYLNRRLVEELCELLEEKKVQECDKQGRISGSLEWRSTRGEIKGENMFIWKLGNRHIIDNKVTIKYSTSRDCYEYSTGNRCVKVEEWGCGVFGFSNIFRKEEKDWEIVYLARSEGTNSATISWRIELENDRKKTIECISLKFCHKVYENGVINVTLQSDSGVNYNIESENCEIKNLTGTQSLTIEAKLSGGKGDVAWQHAQLFRQPMDDEDFPFILTILFKDIN